VPVDEAGALARAATELGLALDPLQQRQLLDYCALLRKWNAVYNLTAVRDPAAMLVQHLFDCLAILPPLRQPPDRLADGAVVLDVGSGGGLPGVVLAICRPGVQVHCVDTVGKKAAFVTQVRADLGLANLHAHHARVESLQAPRDLPLATLVVSRAFSSLAQFVELTAHLLAPGGVWAAMKGQWPDEELAALPPTVRAGAAFTLQVPQLDAARHLLLIEPAA
jgi:16S rRNA (guanine527-N7)-methyltransferase